MDETLEIVPIDESADLSGFNCGARTMNVWLRKRALINHKEGYTKTYIAYIGDELVGYYSLCPTAITSAEYFMHDDSNDRTNAPSVIPCLLMARLAVDKQYQGKGIGTSLIQDAFIKIIGAADIIGGKAVLVDLLESNQGLAKFYSKLGFQILDGSFYRYYLPIVTIKLAMQ